MDKFMADLNGNASGHIIIDNKYFVWKPLTLTKILSLGQAKELRIPINFIDGYIIERKFTWKYLYIAVSGEAQMIAFTCRNPQRVVEELKKYNPYVRMLD